MKIEEFKYLLLLYFIMKDNLKKQGKRVKCPKCSYEFITRSKLIKTSCSSCGNKIKIEENLLE